jgi:hypothetical protein
MKEDAREKRIKHTKRIISCEKKFPIYGFGDIGDSKTIDRL